MRKKNLFGMKQVLKTKIKLYNYKIFTAVSLFFVFSSASGLSAAFVLCTGFFASDSTSTGSAALAPCN